MTKQYVQSKAYVVDTGGSYIIFSIIRLAYSIIMWISGSQDMPNVHLSLTETHLENRALNFGPQGKYLTSVVHFGNQL